jgi:hypothetical protein
MSSRLLTEEDMQKSIERIAGDTDGVSYEFPVVRFE